MYADSVQVFVLSHGETREFEKSEENAGRIAGKIAAIVSPRTGPEATAAYAFVLNSDGEILGIVYKTGYWAVLSHLEVTKEGEAIF